MDKKKFNILYKKMAKPIFDISEMYEFSALFNENNLTDKQIVSTFKLLRDQLRKQLDALR